MMIKFLFVIATILLVPFIMAKTPTSVIAGSIANTWIQGGLRVTNHLFDLAVQGKGFFVLDLPSGDRGFSRYGQLNLDSDGWLTHTTTQGKVLGFCNGVLGPIELNSSAYNENEKIAKSFSIEVNGSIIAIYEDGRAREICRIALSLFQNPRMLKQESAHLLKTSHESGKPSIGLAQSEGRGSITSGTLEELDKQMYRVNLINPSTDTN